MVPFEFNSSQCELDWVISRHSHTDSLAGTSGGNVFLPSLEPCGEVLTFYVSFEKQYGFFSSFQRLPVPRRGNASSLLKMLEKDKDILLPCPSGLLTLLEAGEEPKSFPLFVLTPKAVRETGILSTLFQLPKKRTRSFYLLSRGS